jgi:hypothetical protein
LWKKQRKYQVFSLFKAGQLGIGNTGTANSPNIVLNVIKIYGGSQMTLFLTRNFTVWSVGIGNVFFLS